MKALLAAAVMLAAPATASAFPVVSGYLDHSWANVHDAGAPDGTNRTWLGYVTGPIPANANGTVTPVFPAAGATAGPGSPRGAGKVYTWRYPASTFSGTYDPATRSGTVDFTGGMRFESPPLPAGHEFSITTESPRIVLSGDHGQLFYGGAEPVYDLDLRAATFTDAPTRTTITGIAPQIATEGAVFPATYAKGAGPDRTPNTFGTFALVVSLTPLLDSDPPPAPTADPTPAPTATATPAPPRVSRIRLTRKRLRFRLSRPVPARVKLDRRAFRVPAKGRRVSVRVRLKAGRHKVTVTPSGGDPVTRRVRL